MARNGDDSHANCAVILSRSAPVSRVLRAQSRMGPLQCRRRRGGGYGAPKSMYSHGGSSYSSSSTATTRSEYRRRSLRLPRPPAVGPLPFAVLLVARVPWYHRTFGRFAL